MQTKNAVQKTKTSQRKKDRQVYSANDEFGYKEEHKRSISQARRTKRA